MVVTFDLVSPVFRLFSSQKLKTKTCCSKCAGASQTLRTQAPAALGGCKCSATHARLTPASRSANLVCDVTGLSVFYVVSACPILRGRAARFSRAQLKFEAYLPERKFLTRYSVHCPSCTSGSESAVHLYCSYCDEILTGSIAGPGGKITDHLITIGHVDQEAIALRSV